MRFTPLVAVTFTFLSHATQADILFQEYVVDSFNVSSWGSEFSNLILDAPSVPLSFQVALDLENSSSEFESRIDMQEPGFQYISAHTSLSPGTLNIYSSLPSLQNVFSYQNQSATIRDSTTFSNILFDYSGAPYADMREKGVFHSYTESTVDNITVEGNIETGYFTEFRSIYSSSLSIYAHETFYEFDAPAPSPATVDELAAFIKTYPLEFSFGVQHYTEIRRYEDGEIILFDGYSEVDGVSHGSFSVSGLADFVSESVIPSSVEVEEPATSALIAMTSLLYLMRFRKRINPSIREK